MFKPLLALDYTRVSDDAAILCRRRDFPRAVNVLQRRKADWRRWRQAFRRVAVTADHTLEGPRRSWVEGALREVVTFVPDRALRHELVLDVRGVDGQIDLGDVLPAWTARELWHLAEGLEVPMEYVAMVTPLPRTIDAPIDTARVVLDCRKTATAHRDVARDLAAGLPAVALPEELDEAAVRTLGALQAQQEAAERWRRLSQRLLDVAGARRA